MIAKLRFTAALVFGLAVPLTALATPAPPAEQPTAAPRAEHTQQPPIADDAPPHGSMSNTGKVETGEHDAHGAAAGGHDGGHGGGHHVDPSRFFNFFEFSYRGRDMMNGTYGDGRMTDPHTGVAYPEEEPKSAPFILMVLNFAVLLAILAWKGGPIAKNLAAERHDQIKSALDEAAALRKQAADKLAEYEARLKDADAEIKALVDGMRADAEADQARILAAAEAQAIAMKRDAELRIAAEIELARATLTREVTAAAAAATEKILRDKLTAGDQQKLVASFIGDIQSATAGTGTKEAR